MNQEKSPVYHLDLCYNEREQHDAFSSQPDPPKAAPAAENQQHAACDGGTLLFMTVSSPLRGPISGLSHSLGCMLTSNQVMLYHL